MGRYPATIADAVDHELVIKKSRFLTHVAPVGSVEEAEAVIAGIRKRAWDAAHNCTAMVTGVLGDQGRSSDDGEPSGTAGVPMLEVLRRRELTDVVAVVTRYFGGVKLGAGGLVRRESLTQVSVEVDHADAGRFDNLLRDWAEHHGATLGTPTYGARATLELWAPAPSIGSLTDALAAASAGRVSPTIGATRITDIPA